MHFIILNNKLAQLNFVEMERILCYQTDGSRQIFHPNLLSDCDILKLRTAIATAFDYFSRYNKWSDAFVEHKNRTGMNASQGSFFIISDEISARSINPSEDSVYNNASIWIKNINYVPYCVLLDFDTKNPFSLGIFFLNGAMNRAMNQMFENPSIPHGFFRNITDHCAEIKQKLEEIEPNREFFIYEIPSLNSLMGKFVRHHIDVSIWKELPTAIASRISSL